MSDSYNISSYLPYIIGGGSGGSDPESAASLLSVLFAILCIAITAITILRRSRGNYKLPPLASDSTLTILSKISDSSNPFALYLYDLAKVYRHYHTIICYSVTDTYYSS